MIGLAAIAAVALVGWLWWKGHLGPDAGRKLALVAGGCLSLWLVMRGQVLPGLGLAAATLALGFSGWMRARVAVRPIDEIEARQILGVGLNATADEIVAAHRRRIAEVHPDRGGNPEEARRVNAARDFLLQAMRRPD